MIGIYKIENRINGKIYIGKSKNIKKRFIQHKYYLTKGLNPKTYNRYLKNSVEKHGIENFCFSVLETFEEIDEYLLAEAEIKWMDYYNSYNSDKGYNLKRDSSTKTEMSDSTKKLMTKSRIGELNGNYGNKWSDEQKKIMSEIKKEHLKNSDSYGDEWKAKISAKSKELWKDENKKKQMAKKVAKAKQKYKFHQYDKKSIDYIKTFDSVEDIILENPSYKWQNIYSVCNGYKKSYMGFIWKKELKI